MRGVCVCVCVCVAQLVRVHLQNGNIRNLARLQVQIEAIARYGIISLNRQETLHTIASLDS